MCNTVLPAVISHHDDFNGVFVRAVCPEEGRDTSQVVTVLLLPEDAPAFTPELLTRMCFNSSEELMRFIAPFTCPEDRILHAIRKQMELARIFAPAWLYDDIAFFYSIRQVETGSVLEIRFGKQSLIEMLYFPQVAIEPGEE